MKKYLLIFIVPLLFFSTGCEDDNDPVDDNDNNYVSSDVGYYINNKNLYKTTDGGNTFNIINDNVYIFNIERLQFITESIGYYIDIDSYEDPTLYKTTDGGITFNVINNFPDGIGSHFCFISELIGYFPRSSNGVFQLLKTTDGGVTFSLIFEDSNTTTVYGKLDFINEEIGYCYKSTFFTGSTGFYKTTDGGNSFSHLNNGTNIELEYSPRYLNFINEYVGYYFTTDGLLYKTTDGGFNFDMINDELTLYQGGYSSTTEYPPIPSFIDNLTGYYTMLGDLYKTTDGGISFNIISTNLPGNPEGIYFID